MQKTKVLLIEDEITLAKIIKDTLEMTGFEVQTAHNGQEGLAKYFDYHPHILITDIMMPKLSGLDMVTQIRTTDHTTPIIYLTAKTETDDVVSGFETGANDYIRKPFAMKELIVRIKALTRPTTTNPTPQTTTTHTIGHYQFNPHDNTLTHTPTHHTQQLPNREAEVLHRFCQNQGKLVTTQNILLELWGNDDFFCTRSLQVLITRIRRRLSKDKNIQIQNIRGQGYKLIITPR